MMLGGIYKLKFTLNVIVTLMSMTLIFEISIAREQKDINSMQVQ